MWFLLRAAAGGQVGRLPRLAPCLGLLALSVQEAGSGQSSGPKLWLQATASVSQGSFRDTGDRWHWEIKTRLSRKEPWNLEYVPDVRLRLGTIGPTTQAGKNVVSGGCSGAGGWQAVTEATSQASGQVGPQ